MHIPKPLLLGTVLALSGCANPRAEANVAQALSDAATEMGTLRSEIAQLQTDLDSLRTIVMHQDTVISRIATVTNVPK